MRKPKLPFSLQFTLAKSFSSTPFSSNFRQWTIQEPPSLIFSKSCQESIEKFQTLHLHTGKKELQESDIIRTLLSCRDDPDSAFQYFKFAETRGRFSIISDSLCVLVNILIGFQSHCRLAGNLFKDYGLHDCSMNHKDIIRHWVDCSKRFDFELNSWVFDYLMRGYVVRKKYDEAIGVFREMIKCNVSVSVVGMNKLLTVLVRRNMIVDALDLYKDVVDKGFDYDYITVTVMMRAYLKGGNVVEAERLFWDAHRTGMKLDAATYSTAVHALCVKVDSRAACQLLSEMKKMGWVPSEGTYTSVVCACVKQRDVVQAVRVKEDMISSGHSMNLVVATSLMKGCILIGDLNGAFDLFDKITKDGLKPNKVTYAVLIY